VDQLRSYRELVKRNLSDLAALINEQHPASQSGVDCECVFEDERGHYLLVNVGWTGSRRVRAVTLHARLRNGKIWEEDMTEEGIATTLKARGRAQRRHRFRLLLARDPQAHGICSRVITGVRASGNDGLKRNDHLGADNVRVGATHFL
jgi:hypothetical protein